jgi:glycosyltransferase involved in cell wall biosynthesis
MQVLLLQSSDATSEAAELGRALTGELTALPGLECRAESLLEPSGGAAGFDARALARLAGGALELPRHLLRLRNLARDWKPEIVHALSGPAVLAGVLAARAAGAALVVSEDGWPRNWAARTVRAGLERFGLERAWHLAFTRDAAERLTAVAGVAPERVRFVRPGIAAFEGPPPRRRAMRETWCVDDDEFLLGTLGPLEPRRGLETLLEALARGQESAAKGDLLPRLALVGSGPHEAALRESARRLRLGARVIVAPPPPRLQDALAAFDLYVQPVEQPEAGLDCLRAMASGLAVVASRLAGLDDAIADRVTGLLVPPGDSCLLRDAIWGLGLAQEERAEMGRLGRLRVETYFEAGRMAVEVVRIYEEAAGQNSDGGETAEPDR